MAVAGSTRPFRQADSAEPQRCLCGKNTTPKCGLHQGECGSLGPLARSTSSSSGFRSLCAKCSNAMRNVSRGAPPEGKATKPPLFTAPELLDPLPPIDELIARREKVGQRTIAAHEQRKFLPVQIHLDGPFALWAAGDPHMDDDGCDFRLLREHSQLAVETEGMFAASVGDLQNAWVGRLARLYGNQSTSAREAWALVEWWLGLLGEKLLLISAGNHDCWARNVNGLDPVDWVTRQHGTVYQTNGARVGLIAPNGQTFTVNCRHDFSGRSQFNPAHGATKAAIWGFKDDLLVAGHTHSTGANIIKDPATGKVSHCVRLGSYKTVDDYAIERGFPDSNISECVVAIFDPYETDPRHRVHLDFNPYRGAKTLTMMRKEWSRLSKRKSA